MNKVLITIVKHTYQGLPSLSIIANPFILLSFSAEINAAGQRRNADQGQLQWRCTGGIMGAKGGCGAAGDADERGPATEWALRELHQGHFILVVVPEGQCKVGAYDGTETERTLAAYG